ncbi:M56 family metallopeptidase [Streptomyces silvensis]|uniref:M56 family metallopeptidase n=1 Tax=Streptomyces silvensis TaxID=1765722 RepID=UPI000A5A3645|nr:M56 family metallopeptidase [Streptomyces silvensis]
MGFFVHLPLVLPLSAWPVARLAAQHLHPRIATRLLTALAAVMALCSTLCLALLMVVGTARLPGNPLPDAWSDPEVRAALPYDEITGVAAIPALAVVCAALTRTLWRHAAVRRRGRRALAGLPGTTVVVLPDTEQAYAYALPGRVRGAAPVRVRGRAPREPSRVGLGHVSRRGGGAWSARVTRWGGRAWFAYVSRRVGGAWSARVSRRGARAWSAYVSRRDDRAWSASVPPRDGGAPSGRVPRRHEPPRGRVVVSRALVDRLEPGERRALFAHERAHLAARHHRFLLVTQLAARANPFLLPLRTATAYTAERWADEAAAGVVRDRRAVARAIGKAALAPGGAPMTARTGLAGLTGFAAAGPVPRRVAALLAPAPAARTRPPLFTAVGLALWGAACGTAVSAMSSANAAVTTVLVLRAATPL